MPQHPLVDDDPVHRAPGRLGEDRLPLQPHGYLPFQLMAGDARLAAPDHRSRVVLALEDTRRGSLFPLVDLGRSGLGVDDRSEVAGPRLTGHQLLEVREGGRGAEDLIALCRELGRWRLVLLLYLAGKRVGVPELVRKFRLRPPPLASPAPE